jgi:uncharacterized repeat protein (TIGR01451 family)
LSHSRFGAALAAIVLISAPLSARTLTYTNAARDAQRHLTLRREGARLQLVDDVTHRIVAGEDASSIDRVVIRGADGAHDDSLTIDLSQPLALARGIDYDGGAGGWDVLALRGSARSERVTQLTPHDGVFDIDGLAVRYSNLEPITDTIAAATLLVNGTPGFDNVSVTDGPIVSGDQTTTISSPSFESYTFANKTSVTFNGLGGGDSVNFNNPNPAAGLVTFVATGVGTVGGAVRYPKFGVSATGNVSMDGSASDVDNLEVATLNGDIRFLDSDDVTIGGVDATLNGLSIAGSGTIDIRNNSGNLLLPDADGSVSDAGGDVLLFPHDDLLIGTATTGANVRASRLVDFKAVNITITGPSRIASDDFGTNSGGEAVAGAVFTFTMSDGTAGSPVFGSFGTAGADTSIAGSTLNLLATGASSVSSASGFVQLLASHLTIAPASGVTAPLDHVVVQTFFSSSDVDLGSTTDAAPSTLEISDAEVDRIFTPSLRVQANGTLTVTQPITFTNGTELSLIAAQPFQATGSGSVAAQTLSFTDTSATPRTWTLTSADVTVSGGTPVPYSVATNLNANGGDGADTFDVTPSSTTAFHIDGNAPLAPASPGDTLDVDLTGTTSPTLSFTSMPDGYSGSFAFGNRQPVTFQEIETLANASIDLQIAKSDSAASETPGTTVTYTIIATSPDALTFSGATVTDVFPASIANVVWTCTPSPGSACTPAGSGNINDSITFAGSGATVTYTATGTISPSATGTLANTATIAPPPGFTDPSSSNDTATDVDALTPQSDLSITKSDAPDPVTAGTNVTYTLQLQNAGPSDAQNVNVFDPLPADTTFVSIAAPAGFSCTAPAVGANGSVSCSASPFAVSASPATFTLVVHVAPSVATGTVISNSVTASSSSADPITPNSGTSTTTVAASADLHVSKSANSTTTIPGGTIDYTIALSNAGPSDAANVTLSDVLPPQTVFASLDTPAGYVCTTPAVGAGGTMTCTSATVPAGANDAFTLRVTVLSNGAPGPIVNTATVASSTPDPDPANDAASAAVTIAAIVPALSPLMLLLFAVLLGIAASLVLKHM